MQNRSPASNLGLYVYAGGAIFLGLVGLASGDFATTWQRVGPNVPFREPLAYFTAFIELVAGLALLLPRTARAGALTLTVVYSVFTLVWVPKILEGRSGFDPAGNFFEEFLLVVSGAVLFAWFSPASSPISRRESLFARLSGLSAISFGIVHICRYARPLDLDPQLDSAFADVLGLRDDHRLFPRRPRHSFGHHGTARIALADRRDRRLRNTGLDSQTPRGPS